MHSVASRCIHRKLQAAKWVPSVVPVNAGLKSPGNVFDSDHGKFTAGNVLENGQCRTEKARLSLLAVQ